MTNTICDNCKQEWEHPPKTGLFRKGDVDLKVLCPQCWNEFDKRESVQK